MSETATNTTPQMPETSFDAEEALRRSLKELAEILGPER